MEGLTIRTRHKTNIAITGPYDARRYRARIVRIYSDIELVGGITQDQIALLGTAVEHCPLANTLGADTKIIHNLQCRPQANDLKDTEKNETTEE